MASFRHGVTFAAGYLVFWLCVAVVCECRRGDSAPLARPYAGVLALRP